MFTGRELLSTALILSVYCFAQVESAHAVLVYSQTFDGPGVPSEWAAEDSPGAVLAIADDSAGIGGGNALSLSALTREGTIGSFTQTSLVNIGDSIELSFDVRLTAFPDNIGGFRFGLMQSEVADNSHGYRISVGTGANTPYTSANADGGDPDILFGINRDILRISDDPADTGGIADTLSHSFKLVLTKTTVEQETGIAIRVIQDGLDSLTPAEVVHLESVPVGGANQTAQPLQQTFDQFAISTNGGISGFLDNVQVEYIPSNEQRRLIVNRDDGSIEFFNSSESSLNIIAYSLSSAAGSFDQSGWKTIADNYDASAPGGDQIDSDDEWTILTDPLSHDELSEAEFFGDGGVIGLGESLVLSEGGAWIASNVEDIQLELLLDDGTKLNFNAIYEGNGGQPFADGDLDFDGDVDADDYAVLRDNGHSDLSGLSAAEAYSMGDLNGDGFNNIRDYALLRTIFDSLGQSEAFISAELNYGRAVPEPGGLGLLLLATGLPFAQRRMRKLSSWAVLCTLGLVLAMAACPPASAVIAPITSSVIDTTLDGNGDIVNTANLTSISTAHGTVSNLSHAIAGFGSFDSGGGGSGVRNSWGINGTQIDGAASVLNLDISTGLLNAGDPNDTSSVQVDIGGNVVSTGMGGPTVFLFSQVVTAGVAGSANDFFIIENGGNDEVILKPVDASGIPIGDYSLTINNTSHWGTDFTGGAGYARIGDAVSAGPVATFGGVAFDVEDFSGTTGSLAGMVGFSIESDPSNSGLDTLVIGVNAELAPLPEPVILTAEINTLTGLIRIKNKSATPIDMSAYELTSVDADTFVFSQWSSLSDQNLDPVDDGADNGETWDEVAGSDNGLLAEQFFLGSSTVSSTPLSLGLAYNTGVAGDLIFEYFDVGLGEVVEGLVEMVATPGLQGDFNGDGTVNIADYTVWRNNLGAPTEAALNGNGSDGGGVGPEDYALWKTNFGLSSGSISQVAATQVPEPTTALLALLPMLAVALVRSTPSVVFARVGRCAAFAICLAVASWASATITIEGDYQFGDLADEILFESVAENQIIDATYENAPENDLDFASGDPRYADLTLAPYATNKPAAVGNWGAKFDGDGDSVQRAATGHLTPLGTADIGISLWAFPHGGSNRQTLYFNDVNNVGISITADGVWTQIISAHSNDTDIAGRLAAASEEWVHLMQHTYVTNAPGAPEVVTGTSDGSTAFTTVLYVNGVAISAHADNHTVSTGAALLMGAENPANPQNSFNGVLGDAKLYNTNSFNLFMDNESLVQQIAALSSNAITDGDIPVGDVNVDGVVDNSDVTAFVAGWNSKNRFDGFHADLTVGDLTTWQEGDMNLDGRVDLDDVFLMNVALEPLGGFDLSLLPFGAEVPEPHSVGLIALALGLTFGATRRYRN